MIYATFGTAGAFPRLLARLDELAAETGMEFIVQTGNTPQTAGHCRMFDFVPSQKEYFQQADMVIAHAGLGTQLELLQMHRPFVVAPRLAEFGEHNDNHQLETCEILHRKYGILFFEDLKMLTQELLVHPPKPYPFTDETLQLFRRSILPIIMGEKK